MLCNPKHFIADRYDVRGKPDYTYKHRITGELMAGRGEKVEKLKKFMTEICSR